MAKPHMGAHVIFCGHEGTFVADIHEVAGANVVRANGPVTAENLQRGDGAMAAATHHMTDFPSAGYWGARIGVFVVPAAQVKELK